MPSSDLLLPPLQVITYDYFGRKVSGSTSLTSDVFLLECSQTESVFPLSIVFSLLYGS